jgi:MerR family transcriptional regulator/heat shock protein HspR
VINETTVLPIVGDFHENLNATGRAMTKEFWTVQEVIRFYEIDETFVHDLVEEGILCPTCREHPSDRVFAQEELEKVRIAKVLMEDMGVNLAGVDVILSMRRQMAEMRRQFDDILEALAHDIQETLKKSP